MWQQSCDTIIYGNIYRRYIMKATSKARLATLILSDAQRFAALKQEFVQLDEFCKGTVLKRLMTCGNKQCGLPPRSGQTSRAVSGMHLQGPQQDRQLKALPRSGSSLPCCNPATSQIEIASRASGTLVANRLGASGPTGAIPAPQLNENRGYSYILPPSRLPSQPEST